MFYIGELINMERTKYCSMSILTDKERNYLYAALTATHDDWEKDWARKYKPDSKDPQAYARRYKNEIKGKVLEAPEELRKSIEDIGLLFEALYTHGIKIKEITKVEERIKGKSKFEQDMEDIEIFKPMVESALIKRESESEPLGPKMPMGPFLPPPDFEGVVAVEPETGEIAKVDTDSGERKRVVQYSFSPFRYILDDPERTLDFLESLLLFSGLEPEQMGEVYERFSERIESKVNPFLESKKEWEERRKFLLADERRNRIYNAIIRFSLQVAEEPPEFVKRDKIAEETGISKRLVTRIARKMTGKGILEERSSERQPAWKLYP